LGILVESEQNMLGKEQNSCSIGPLGCSTLQDQKIGSDGFLV